MMNDQIAKPVSLQAPPDMLSKRLRWAILASLLVNLLGWRAVAAMAKRPLYVPPRDIEITRIIIDNKGHKVEKKIDKAQIKNHIQKIKRPVIQPKTQQAVYHPPVKQTEPQHSKVLTAPGKGLGNDEPTVLGGGDAKVGIPVEQQPPAPEVKAVPTTVVTPVPVPPVVKVPEPVKVKQPDPTPPPVVHPDPPPVQPVVVPVKKGPTKESEPLNEIKPEIPDELKHGDFKSFVRVKVEIDEDGKPTPILRTSSGNAEIDRRVLEALRKWKWKPALEKGTPVSSTQLFKFEFLVE